MKKNINGIIGSLLIASSLTLFFIPSKIVSNGFFGIITLLNYNYNISPELFLIIINFILIIISLIIKGPEYTKKYTIASILIPLFMFGSKYILDYISFTEMDMILNVIVGSFLLGKGYSLLLKSGLSTGGVEIIQETLNKYLKQKNDYLTYIINTIIVLTTFFLFGLETTIYSLIAILIISYSSRKSEIGVSSNKTFFIITSKETEVKDYIINTLKQDLTEFDTKGGFSKEKGKILMTAVDTKNYYKLKEEILLIDPKAFISITDGYEVINKNISVGKLHESL